MAWTEVDILREEAWIALEMEPDEGDQLMSDDEFDDEVERAARGDWEELGLDPLPSDFQPATIEDLRNADSA